MYFSSVATPNRRKFFLRPFRSISLARPEHCLFVETNTPGLFPSHRDVELPCQAQISKKKKHCCKRSALPIYTPSFFHFFYFFAPCRLTTDFGRIFTAPTWVCDAIVAPAVATFLPLLLVWTSRAAISFSQWSLACRYSIIVVLASSTDECSPSVQQDFGKNK